MRAVNCRLGFRIPNDGTNPMNSATLIIVLIVEYIIIAVVAALERPPRWPLVLYYVAAAMISVAVLWMRTEAGEVTR